MSDWLSEIEYWTNDPLEDTVWVNRAKRMARVLRELAWYIAEDNRYLYDKLSEDSTMLIGNAPLDYPVPSVASNDETGE